MNLIEKILANHSDQDSVKPGDIVDIFIDARAARDFGGPNVVKIINENKLTVEDPERSYFTFDTNPTGSDQKYAVNQQIVRTFARDNGVKVFDINKGIGTHTMISEGLSYPGSTAVTTDSHANILGAVGAFGQGMGDKDIAAAFVRGKVWFKVPESVKITFTGKKADNISAKDIVLNLLHQFGANQLLGYSVELYGNAIDALTLDERITIASMGTEMGAIIILFPPNKEVIDYCQSKVDHHIDVPVADKDASYAREFTIDIESYVPMVSRPGEPHDTVPIPEVMGRRIDSAFLGSCTNGRIEDMRIAAKILKGKKVAPWVVMKVVPSTDDIWNQCLAEGLIQIFKDAGAMVSNAGCAGCAAGQVGQNGPGEVTISTGNRNFPGKQGKGEVYLASPATVAASAVSGYISDIDSIKAPNVDELIAEVKAVKSNGATKTEKVKAKKTTEIKGRVWYINQDNIDTDMIFHNRYLAITNIDEMGQYTFDNLDGYTDFASKCQKGDIVVTGKNFGSGSSRQQAVDCFAALGVQAIIAESFGAIYERNAINAAFPIISCEHINELSLESGDIINVNMETGMIINETKSVEVNAEPFSSVQMEIYQNDGLF
ncbi:MAG: aconitase/3-isopropylmalate dehydratase large subunit family protein [Hyphomicrobiales bacterium]